MALSGRLAAALLPAVALRRALAQAEAGQLREAFPALARAARRGHADAQYADAHYWVGRAYLEGQGVPHSRADAQHWLTQAATAHHTQAQTLLATIYVSGTAKDGADLFVGGAPGGVPDPDRAKHWAELAAGAGSADAKALLAYLLTSGPEEARDPARAAALYAEAADAGSMQGALGHGLVLLRTACDDAARQAAAMQIGRAADAGLSLGLYLMGTLHESGTGVPQDPAAAAAFHRQAAERGLRSAQARWGRALLDGYGGIRRDPVGGESWLRRAALAGDADAAVTVGELYAKGGELPPNYAEAALWFTRAAEAGHAGGARALGMLYLTGAGVARDPDEAARWLRRSAEGGLVSARGALANLVLARAGGPADRPRTREWFEQAAEAGDLVAAFNFGVCLAEGVGIERDDRRAAMWLRRAAEAVPNAQYWYGRVLAEGRGVEADPAEARRWIARAAEAGLIEAKVALAGMLVNGRGGPADPHVAGRLLEHAARQGHVGAIFALGALLDGGHGVPQDRAAAQGWLRQAAERGHGSACLMLGRYLAHGIAGPVDLPSARAWLEQARQRGVVEAEADLALLLETATAGQEHLQPVAP